MTNLTALADPFPAADIEWRIQSSGTTKQNKRWARVLAYVTNRAIQQRLDDVCGPANWRNEYTVGPGGGVLCGISIYLPNGLDGFHWVTKWDGAENTDIEQVKGGLSGAMKRAAVQWGIGRYLYNLEEGWANIHAEGEHRSKDKDGEFRWDPPRLPAWALPQAHPAPLPPAAPPSAPEDYVVPFGRTTKNKRLGELDDATINLIHTEALKRSDHALAQACEAVAFNRMAAEEPQGAAA